MDMYEQFIWSAYGATAILLVTLLAYSLFRYRIAQRQLDELVKNNREQGEKTSKVEKNS
ncbi:MAG: heme exporter protein CcmD [Rhodospirillaceae bacterium]|nr:heme exporter protein CcmD [Rhodospirillaceae bacterium]OUU20146.1 MAG: heme exporter protein CcmD [Candidatus Endolissoclinum sp. TMED37]